MYRFGQGLLFSPIILCFFYIYCFYQFQTKPTCFAFYLVFLLPPDIEWFTIFNSPGLKVIMSFHYIYQYMFCLVLRRKLFCVVVFLLHSDLQRNLSGSRKSIKRIQCSSLWIFSVSCRFWFVQSFTSVPIKGSSQELEEAAPIPKSCSKFIFHWDYR